MDETTNPTKITQAIELTAPEWEAMQNAARSLHSSNDGPEPLTPSGAISALISHVSGSQTLPDTKADTGTLQVSIQEHGGAIVVSSQHGDGCQFEISLPLSNGLDA